MGEKMIKESISSIERLKEVEKYGKKILFVDFEGSSVEESSETRYKLFNYLKKCEKDSVRLFVNAKNNSYSPSGGKDWKVHIELLNEKVLKTAIIGLSPIAKMALLGVRAYAK